MKGVTREKARVDRIACPWLIKRFIDTEATFGFIGRQDPVPAEVIPFVLPGAEINPVEGVKLK